MKTFLRLFLIVSLLAITAYFNIGLIDLRMREMSYLIGKIAARQDVPMSLGIVAKYELIKHRMLYGEQNPDNYELEAKMQALTSGDQFEKRGNDWQTKIYKLPVRLVVNCIRLSIGKPIIHSSKLAQRHFPISVPRHGLLDPPHSSRRPIT